MIDQIDNKDGIAAFVVLILLKLSLLVLWYLPRLILRLEMLKGCVFTIVPSLALLGLPAGCMYQLCVPATGRRDRWPRTAMSVGRLFLRRAAEIAGRGRPWA